MGNKATVGDFVSLQRGITYKGKLVGEPGPALLGLGSIQPGGGFREGDYKTYGGECPENIMLSPGDLFASLKGATKDGEMIGSVAKLPESVETGRLTQDTVKLDFHDPNDQDRDFLYWVLRTPQYRAYCGGRATGSAVVALSRNDFLNFPVPAITPERLEVVELLETIHHKIELNRRMNATLEGMAQALFKSWFVDFDPVIDNALAAGNPIPDELAPRAEVRKKALASRTTQQGSVDYPTLSDPQSLFPAAFQKTEELGWIPEGWEACRLGDVCRVINGRAYKNTEFKESGTPIVRIQNLSGKGKTVYSDLELPNDKLIDCDDLIFAWSATFGPHIWRGPKSIYHYHIWKMDIEGSKMNKFLLYFILKRETDAMRDAATGSIFTHLTKKTMDGLPVALPSEQVINEAATMFDPAFESITQRVKESATLEHLRGTLLPKLISGELEIAADKQLTKEALA